MHVTSFEDMRSAYEAGRPSIVTMRLVADLETPVSAFLKISAQRSGDVFLLESVEGGATRGRYSMIGLDPDLAFRVFGDRAEINRGYARGREAFEPCPGKPLDALRALLKDSRIDKDEVHDVVLVSWST